MRGFLFGVIFGLSFVGTLAAVNFRRIARKDPPSLGLEWLAKGTTEWRALEGPGAGEVKNMWKGKDGRLLVSTAGSPYGSAWDGKKWTTTQELPPQHEYHPTIPDMFWHLFKDDGTWLTVKAGDCGPVLEPSKKQLPPVPRCEPEKFHYRTTAVTRTTDGSILLVYWHQDDQTFRAWKLAKDATAWVDTGALPLVAASATLVAGFDGTALIVGGDGVMARYDGTTWTKLPMMKSERIGWVGALAEDGSVFAAGGFPDRKKTEATTTTLILLGFLAAGVFFVRTWKLSIVGSLLGIGVGGALVVAAFFALLILFGARY